MGSTADAIEASIDLTRFNEELAAEKNDAAKLAEMKILATEAFSGILKTAISVRFQPCLKTNVAALRERKTGRPDGQERLAQTCNERANSMTIDSFVNTQIPDFQFVLPESFEPREFLKGRLTKRLDDARYLISLILWKMATGRTDERGRVPLMAKYLEQVMAKDDCYRVMDRLLDEGIIHRDYYIQGERSYSYWLGNQFRDVRHVRVTPTDKRLSNRLHSFFERQKAEHELRMLPVHHHLRQQQFRLGIDMQQAEMVIGEMPIEKNAYDCQAIVARNLAGRRFLFKVGKYGRISNNICNMSRLLRRALRHNGNPLFTLDIKNSQPALLATMIDATATGRTARRREQPLYDPESQQGQATPDGSRYCELAYCELAYSGRLYDFIQEELNCMSRDEIKRRFLCDVLAKRKANSQGDEYPSVIESWFSKVFPAIYSFIRRINRSGWEHANLIRMLQQAEADLVIGTVCETLRVKCPTTFVVTLHDSVYSTEENMPTIRSAFEEAFESSGYRFALSC